MVHTNYRKQSRYFATRSRTRGLSNLSHLADLPGTLLHLLLLLQMIGHPSYLGYSFMCANLLFTVHQAGPGLKVGFFVPFQLANVGMKPDGSV